MRSHHSSHCSLLSSITDYVSQAYVSEIGHLIETIYKEERFDSANGFRGLGTWLTGFVVVVF